MKAAISVEGAPSAHGRQPVSGSLLLSIPGGHHVEDLLRGPFLRRLLDARPTPRVVVVSPFVSDPGLASELADAGVGTAPMPFPRDGLAARIVESMLCERFLIDSGLRAVRLQRDRARLLDDWPGRGMLVLLKSALSRLPVSRRTWYHLARLVTNVADCQRLLESVRPDLVVTSTAGCLPSEAPLIYAARRQGVPQMGVDLGWDNLSSKYHTVVPVDHLAVWNETMREEAVRYHGFRPDQVAVTGAVPFDLYFRRAELPTRDQFCRTVGVNPARPLVTLATAPAQVYPTTANVARTLATAAQSGALGCEAQLLVRVHPRDQLSDYTALHDGHQVFVEKPFEQLERAGPQLELEAFTPGRGGRRRLAATLAHSDVLVNFASTTTIEAALFDTPVVNVGFDDEPGLPLPLSIGRYYEYEHYQPVVDTGAARVATSSADLVSAVRGYLEDPTADRDGRRELVSRCCTRTDGRAGERLADWVLETLASVTASGGAS